jgi:hypothetical protein
VGTITRLHDKCETGGAVQNVNRGWSVRPSSSNNNESVVTVLPAFTQSLKKFVRQCSHEIGISKTIIHHILQHEKWKPYTPRLLHALNEDDPDCQMEFCECFFYMCDERESFPNFIVWSDEANFKLNGTVNQHSYVYSATENPRVTFE